MPRPRLSGHDRRQSIVEAAKTVFAMNGFEGAKTFQIARTAGVSEALVYRHFPSKTALYRAVLRHVIHDQDATLKRFGAIEPSARGIVDMLVRTARNAIAGDAALNALGMRLVFGSLAADGSYARLVYRRASRLVLPQVRAAMAAAESEGALESYSVAPENAVNFVEHVTTMIQMTRSGGRPAVEHPEGNARLIADCVRFCARGIGLRAEVVERLLGEALAPDYANDIKATVE